MIVRNDELAASSRRVLSLGSEVARNEMSLVGLNYFMPSSSSFRTDVSKPSMAAKENDDEEEKERTRNKRRTTRWFIPPATAYAFIIIHEIPRRRFCELLSADRIEAADREAGKGWRRRRAERKVLFRRENISSKQKQDELPTV